MKKNKQAKITAEDLMVQARNESLPPVTNQSECEGVVIGSSAEKVPEGHKTIENAPRVGEEQAP